MPPAAGRLQRHGARAERPRPERRGAHPARGRVPAVSFPWAPGPPVTTRGGAKSGWPLRPWGWAIWLPSQRHFSPYSGSVKGREWS